jgi:hypothetical protein
VIVARARVRACADETGGQAGPFAYAALVVFGMAASSSIRRFRSRTATGTGAGLIGSFADLVSQHIHTRGRSSGRLLWAHIRLVHDLSWRALLRVVSRWHVGQFAVLTVLFLRSRLAADASLVDAAAIRLVSPALVGMQRSQDVREAFPINTFMTILICCYLRQISRSGVALVA